MVHVANSNHEKIEMDVLPRLKLFLHSLQIYLTNSASEEDCLKNSHSNQVSLKESNSNQTTYNGLEEKDFIKDLILTKQIEPAPRHPHEENLIFKKPINRKKEETMAGGISIESTVPENFRENASEILLRAKKHNMAISFTFIKDLLHTKTSKNLNESKDTDFKNNMVLEIISNFNQHSTNFTIHPFSSTMSRELGNIKNLIEAYKNEIMNIQGTAKILINNKNCITNTHNLTKIRFSCIEKQNMQMNQYSKMEVTPDTTTTITDNNLHLINNTEENTNELDLKRIQHVKIDINDWVEKLIKRLPILTNDHEENFVETFQVNDTEQNNDTSYINAVNKKNEIIKVEYDINMVDKKSETVKEIVNNVIRNEPEIDYSETLNKNRHFINIRFEVENSPNQTLNINRHVISIIEEDNSVIKNTPEMGISGISARRKCSLQDALNINHLGVRKSDAIIENYLDHEQRVNELMSLLKQLKLQTFNKEKEKSEYSDVINNKIQKTKEVNRTPMKCLNLLQDLDSHTCHVDHKTAQTPNITENIIQRDEKNKIKRHNCESRSTNTDIIKGHSRKLLPRSPKSMNLRSRRVRIPRNIKLSYSHSEEEYEEQVEKILPPPKPMDWKTYHRLDVIYSFLDELESNYPSLCSVHVIGQSLEGRHIKILRISNSQEDNSPVWIDAGIHAREWIAPAVNTYIANHIARNFKSLPKYMTDIDWYFLPVANPDGYEYSHTHNRLWRKNKACIGNQCFGVDLNRNFSYGWGCGGSSSNPAHSFYRGVKSFSEPETQAIKNAILHSGIKFKVYLTLHCYGQKIIFPFACKEELCPNYVRLLHGAAILSKAIFETNGNIYMAGTSKDMMYRASGTSQDWCYGVAHVPYCYLIELCEKKHKFKMPPEDIEAIGNEILNSVKALMEFVYKQPDENNVACLQQHAKEQAQPPTQVWEIRFIREGQRHFVKTLDSVGGVYVPNPADLEIIFVVALCDEEELSITFNMKILCNMIPYRKLLGQRILIRDQTFHGFLFFVLNVTRAIKLRSLNIWTENVSTMDIMVEGSRRSQVAGILHEREIPYSIAISDVGALMQIEKNDTLSTSNARNSSNYPNNSMNWLNYHRLDVIYTFMQNLVNEFPYLCSLQHIGKSVEGRPLLVLKISNGNKSNVGVWIDGSIHSREWISTAVVTYIADTLVRNYSDQSDTVTNKDWYLLPVLNPDGYDYTHTHDRLWRKNRHQYGESLGVDLNRNFSFGWGELGEEGSSDDPSNIFYRGPKPFSEPECDAVRKAILYSDTQFKVFLSLHSYGEVVIFPYGYTSDPCPDYVELMEGGLAMVKAIYETSGRVYRVGSTKDLMYYAAGTSVDWSYGAAKIPYSYMLELRSKTHRFLLPKEEIMPTATEVYHGVLRLMDFVDKRCKGTQSCVCRK